MRRKVLVLGASNHPERYSYKATLKLLQKGFDPILVGRKQGQVQGIEILQEIPFIENLDTVTVYLSAANQKEYYAKIVELQPKQVIFNPGAENKELSEILETQNIHFENACTLVLLSGNLL